MSTVPFPHHTVALPRYPFPRPTTTLTPVSTPTTPVPLQEGDATPYLKDRVTEYINSKPWESEHLAHMYYTFPDAALQQARRPAVTLPADAWLYSNRKVYICAWDSYFPDRLKELFGRPYPPCWKCYQNRFAEAKAKGTAQAEAEKSAREAAASRINRNGWIKQPRPFVDMDGRHYVYSPIYRCRGGCNSELCRPGLKGGRLHGDLTAGWTVHIVLIVIE